MLITRYNRVFEAITYPDPQLLSSGSGVRIAPGIPQPPLEKFTSVHNVKSGLSNEVIQSLGGWESPDMVSRYAASLTFDEALKVYKSVNIGELRYPETAVL